mgnify:FL=1
MPLYKKKIGYVAGTEARKAEAQVYGDNKKISDDAKNRKYVGEKIKKLIKEGMSEEKIVEEILKDKVMERFEYLKSINPDTSVFVRNWVEDAIKKKNKREKQERER